MTEVLDESSWANVLTLIVEFLRERGVENMTAEFGFILARGLRGEKTPEDRTVRLDQFEALMALGFRDGTIKWGGDSDFHFTPVGLSIEFLLCNDGDLHFSSPDFDMLLKLSQPLSKHGIKVYCSGDLVETDRVKEVEGTNAIGWIGFGILILAWLIVYSTTWLPGFPSGTPHLTSLLFAASAVATFIALVLAIECARRRSKWWYLLAAASLISAFVLLADFLVGD